MSKRILIGWREWVALPGLGIDAVRAKVDTGARSSALHVDDHWRFSERGAPWVGFRLRCGPADDCLIEAAAPVADEREVIDSGGHCTRRVFVRTTLRVAGVAREIEVNLTSRHRMLFPMLLGRTAISRAFTVDPARSFLHGRMPPATAPVQTTDETGHPLP
ncbi:MAG TPA: RimK/LysX family protein [Lysobacter sp.]|nr:RimK/LysX family protein [Lysobacter sp.]